MLQTLGLIDVHHSQHPHLPTTATCNKNNQDIPVDGIWASPSIDVIAAGYYGFGELVMGKTDHRMIWADFSFESVFGFEPPEATYIAPPTPNAQRPTSSQTIQQGTPSRTQTTPPLPTRFLATRGHPIRTPTPSSKGIREISTSRFMCPTARHQEMQETPHGSSPLLRRDQKSHECNRPVGTYTMQT